MLYTCTSTWKCVSEACMEPANGDGSQWWVHSGAEVVFVFIPFSGWLYILVCNLMMMTVVCTNVSTK